MLGLPLQELRDGLCASADLEFFVNAADIGVNGFVADPQLFGDFFVKKALTKTIEDFLLALGKILVDCAEGPVR